MDFANSNVKHHIPQREFNIKLFRYAYKQLKYWYPQATIHVLTNTYKHISLPGDNVQYHIIENLRTNYIAKFELYGLLDKPALYIDTDIIIKKPFDENLLIDIYDFQLFWTDGSYLHPYNHYNSGIIWIPNPSKLLTKQLKEIHYKLFYNKGVYHNNDEFALSHFIHYAKWQMPKITSICVPRNYPHFGENLNHIQSIHYQLNTKYDYFIGELKKYGRISKSYL